ncbi:MAG: cadherin-like domain-containing protein [Thiobacillus sp.]|nr:cadherin-like domain-containing protein [Thiobacillus sp.]
MKRDQSKYHAQVFLLAALPFAVGQALAAEYWLQTGTTSVMGVPMWGYASCTASFASCGPVTVPGPALTVLPADGSLTVHLKNTLPEPTSLVIPGQAISDPVPVWTDGTSGPRGADLSKRVRSFTHEAAAGGGLADYAWAALKPGTYLYESGSHPQVQVQMGLYGSLSKDAAAGNVAYRQGGTDIVYSSQMTLLYSEIDPALHDAVNNGTFGPCPIANPNCGNMTSTLEYHPKYFLINGKAYPDADLSPIATVPAGQNSLVRFLNASLKSHVPTINGQYWRMIAEDGNPAPFLSNPRQQYTAFLAPGKTLDVVLNPPNVAATTRYPIFDSRLFDTNNGAQGGGMLAYLDVTPAAATPAAPVFDSTPVLTATAGMPYSYTAHATDPNGDAVSYSLNAGFPAGMVIGASTGLVSWTPAAAGSYPVSVRATDGTLFNDQGFSIAVSPPPNSPPTARNDSYAAVAHPLSSGLTQVVAAPGVLANDTDPDGNALHTTAATIGRVTLNADGRFTLAPAGTGNGSTGTVSFTYQALDTSNAASGTATATITVALNRAPVAAADALAVPRCTTRLSGSTCRTGAGYYQPLSLNLVSNDSDPDSQTIDVANQLPLAVARVRNQANGTNGGSTTTLTTSIGGIVTIAGGSVTYVPPYNFAGTDVFRYRVKDKLGKESGSTTSNTNNLGQGWVTVTVTVQ